MKALFVLAFVALSIVSGSSASQQSPFEIRRAGALHHATLDLATGSSRSTAGPPPPCWANTDTSGFFTFSGTSGGIDEWIVFGNSLTSADPSGTTGCPDATDVIGSFSFGYASNALDASLGGPGAAMTLVFYHDPDGVGGVGPPTLGGSPEVMPANLAAAFSFSGLPAASLPGTSVPSWVISVDLVASGAEFILRDDGDSPGAFGFGWVFDQFGTGPLICYAGDGLGGLDGNGQVAVFDWYAPPAYLGGDYLGSFFFGGAPFDRFLPQYLTLGEDTVGCGGPTISPPRSGAGNANGSYRVLNPAQINGVWVAEVDDTGQAGAALAFVLGYLGPLDATIGLGTVLVDVFHPIGEVLRLAPSFFGSGGPGLAAFSAAVPSGAELCGTQVFSQAVRLGGGVQLTNAVDFTIGF